MGLFDFFSAKPAQDAAAARTTGFNAGYGQLSDLYGQGRDVSTSTVQPGIDMFNQLFKSGQAGSAAYSDATGAGGAEGLTRARDLFTQTPGYTEGLNLTLDQNDRRAASRGTLGSGNTIADTTKLATDYSNQKYGDYVSRLQPFLGATTSAASGAGGLYGGLADMLGKSFQGQGGAANAAQTGIGDANAAAKLADYQASGNLWNTLIGGATAAAKAYAGGK